jgi:hypothetical protein
MAQVVVLRIAGLIARHFAAKQPAHVLEDLVEDGEVVPRITMFEDFPNRLPDGAAVF